MDSESTSKRGPIIALAALIVVLAAAFFAYDALARANEPADTSGAASSASSAEAGEDLPQLIDYNPTVYSETGQPFTFTDIADGRPLVVNFWATWCPYCVQEMPDFQQIYNEYSNRVSFAFVDCADGQRETVEDGAAWLEEQGLDLPAYYDTKQEAVYRYGASSLPTTVVADASGNILSITPGRIDPALMRDALDSLFAE